MMKISFKIQVNPRKVREDRMTRLRIFFVCFLPISLFVSGCGRPEKKMQFEPNLVLAQATKIKVGDIYPMETAVSEATTVVNEMFGSPNEPKLPNDLLEDEQKSFLNTENLEKASGPVAAGRGLYRQHCIACHGVTGNGRGINAMQADVYPRDFRMGKFKFKSTTRGAKPMKEDLYTTIRHGIAGTTMVAIKELSDEDVNTLVDYVIYLSVRGEVERNLIIASEEIAFEEGDHLYLAGSKGFDDNQKDMVKETVAAVMDSWVNAESKVKQAPEPGDVPITATVAELRAAAASDQDSPLKKSIARGKELFAAETASCYKCHGPKGYGDGGTQDYDAWTKDWTSDRGIDPTNEEALIPLQALGGLPPRKIVPRDFRKGIYRGGAAPEKLYLRIAHGIDGTPMPAAEGVLQPADIWSLINYVRSLEEPSKDLTAN